MLTCRVLGPVEIEVDGRPVPVRGPAPPAPGHRAGRRSGAPRQPPANPKSSLFFYVSRLRAGFGADREALVRNTPPRTGPGSPSCASSPRRSGRPATRGR
ncbi:hypothetical protein Q0Z83_047470 [Actinoplanes sichuanensis]|uniref:Uncharacterized protein n=1 Tax=Actinoplanes sichuanensis TaxID=512349 RepID=A0ABW4AP87_9ACTN|nr:hypothetical protein [Actinoplanes sichuanensis]BEL06556.1 hypothetical protein Q0Z83_047470 [Actinoplanes sichuanensis]